MTMLIPSSFQAIELPIAKQEDILTTDELVQKIQACSDEQITGQLDLSLEDIHFEPWRLYFHLGNLIGGSGGIHPVRRWLRQLSRHCPQLKIDSQTSIATLLLSKSARTKSLQPHHCWDYDSLATLVKQGAIPLHQMAAVVEGTATEILFEIIQRGEQRRYRSGVKLTYRYLNREVIGANLVSVRANRAWQQTMQVWDGWQQAGFASYSPNLAPVISQPERLQQRTSPVAYDNLANLVDGNRTLWDLAVKLKQHLVPLTQSLMPYIYDRSIELREIEDLPPPAKPHHQEPIHPLSTTPLGSTTNPTLQQSKGATIACIDDSQFDSQQMSQILTKAGYRCVIIQDSVQALVQLLEHKPSLIFLDLVMPVANGYEICAQIRRVSLFKTTPVIILTNNDGVVDRVRARLVGASGFLSKPIAPEKVLTILKRHLPSTAPKSIQTKQAITDWSCGQQV
jgi:chemotaxis family two-component system response regulator PixG